MDGDGIRRMVATSGQAPGVLIADDEPEIRDLLEWDLPRRGFTVWAAADGEQAVELYRRYRERIAVVLLDVDMPRLDGPGALAALRELNPEVLCCFMSGDLGRYTEAWLRAQGAQEVLAKPFRLRDMAQLLGSLIERELSRTLQSASLGIEVSSGVPVPGSRPAPVDLLRKCNIRASAVSRRR
jgi:CheY-like chemotaxis protein